jgi:hypothetical protein
MPKPRRTWLDFPSQFLTVFQNLAAATPPIVCGPKTKGEAEVFRKGFYAFRDALRGSVAIRDGSLPARLLDGLEILSAKIEPSPDDPMLYNLIFDVHPIVAEANRIDPAAAQSRRLSQIHFAVAQRLLPISQPMFSDEEMEERIEELKKG